MIFDWPNDPDWTPMSSSFRPATASRISTSPYDGSHKAFALSRLWMCEATWNNKRLELVHDIQAFLDQLEGPSNPVRMFDWWRRAPFLISQGSDPWSDGTFFDDGTGWSEGFTIILMAGVTLGQRILTVEGLPASEECFRRGDLIGVKHVMADAHMESYLYEVKAGVTSNSLGQASIIIQPGLRGAAAIGDVVTTYRPTVPMRLMDDASAVIQRSLRWGEGFTLRFVEDIP